MKQPRLTKAATRFICGNDKLMSELSPLTGIKIAGIYNAVTRRSTTMTTYLAVQHIAKEMGVSPESIVELTD